MIKFILKDTLDEYKISGNTLVKHSQIRSNTVYDIINNKTKRIGVDTLEALIVSLRELTNNQEIDIHNVLVFV